MDVDARLEALQAENERLRDEIAMLRESFMSDAVILPREWMLTGKEARVFGALLARESCTKPQLMAACYEPGVDDEPQIKIVDVFVCKLRKKLKPFGVIVETIWGHGYRIAPEIKTVAKAQIAGQAMAA